MNAKTSFLAVFAPLLLTGCNNVDYTLEVNKPKDPAAEMVENFYASAYSKSRTAGAKIDVSEISVARYRIESDSSVTALPENAGSRSLDPNIFEIKTVKFNVNNESGYAILSDDARLNSVYYFTEHGSISDTAKIEPLKEFIEMVPQLAKDDIIGTCSEPNEPVTGEPFIPIPIDSVLPPSIPIEIDSVIEKIGPIIEVKWGQNYPYNMYGKECYCDFCTNPKENYKHHNPIGCAAVAGAQIIAKCGKFKGTFYGNGNIDFEKMISIINAQEADEATQIAFGHFFHEIALGCQIRFGCDGSSTTLKALWQYLRREQGYDCDYISGNLDDARLKKDLRNGFPHAMRGYSGSKGHVWIISGYIGYRSGKNEYYCCWGLNGDGDGWLKIPYSQPNYASYYKDHKHIYINSLN